MVKIKNVHFLWFTLQNWLGSRVVSVLDSAAEAPGSNRSRNAVDTVMAAYRRVYD